MKKTSCEMIRDLLPLYAENMCSDESRQIVAEHLSGCAACKEELQKLNTGITVHADQDIAAIRRIKRRIRIEKIGISAAVAAFLLLVLYLLYLFMTYSYCNLDYEKYNLANTVTVEEAENGDIFMVLDTKATVADSMIVTTRDSQGRHSYYDKEFSLKDSEAFGFTLQVVRIKTICPNLMVMPPERVKLFNKYDHENWNEVFYYDADTKTEHILWERS